MNNFLIGYLTSALFFHHDEHGQVSGEFLPDVLSGSHAFRILTFASIDGEVVEFCDDGLRRLW